MIFTALFNNILFFKLGISSICLLFLPTLFLSSAEVCITVGSLCLFYQESPRRSQAVMISVFFLSRYCGSLLFYTVLPILSSICKLDNSTGPIPHYEYGVLLLLVVAIIFFIVHVMVSIKYCSVTEAELDQECEALKPDRILHPYLLKKENGFKYYGKIME